MQRWLSAHLAATPWRAFRWECPATSLTSWDRPFECVVVEAPELAETADARPFADAFARHAGALAFAMPNLGGDAHLIVPTPQNATRNEAVYPHLAAFLRGASEAQQQVHGYTAGRFCCVANAAPTTATPVRAWASTSTEALRRSALPTPMVGRS
jgi:hypothetical protein